MTRINKSVLGLIIATGLISTSGLVSEAPVEAKSVRTVPARFRGSWHHYRGQKLYKKYNLANIASIIGIQTN